MGIRGDGDVVVWDDEEGAEGGEESGDSPNPMEHLLHTYHARHDDRPN